MKKKSQVSVVIPYDSCSNAYKIANTCSVYGLHMFFMLMCQVFWDYIDKKQLGTTRAEWSVTSEWSADGCYFMTATTAPRLQVDNGYVLFAIT